MKKTFWDRAAKIYDRFMRMDRKVYEQTCYLIYPVVRHRKVLELASGTGLDGTKKRGTESRLPIDLRRMCKGEIL